MRELADYLDAFDGRRGRELATVPSTPLILTNPVILRPPSGMVSSLLAIFSAEDKARVDSQMWSLDARWTGHATFRSMRLCVRPRGDVAGGIVSTPVSELGPAGCRTSTGALVDPTCNWGFWAVDKCDLDTASTLIFQFGRYLWAQARMRDLLATKPTPMNAQDGAAAEWAWKAAQLISALLWSTNVRFDNPNAAYVAGDYAANLRAAGLLAPGALSGNGGIPFDHWSQPPDNNLGFAYDGPALASTPYFAAYTLLPRALNSFGYKGYAPTRQNDFSPGGGPLRFMDRTAVPTGSYLAVGGTPYLSYVPAGLTPEQAEEVRRLAYSYYTASGDVDALRWASTKAFIDYWFRLTWSWPTLWRPVPGVTGRGRPLVLGGARLIIEDLARQLQFYSSPSKSYIAWMQSALQTFNLETPIQPTSPAAIDFVNAKQSLLAMTASAAAQSEAASRSGTTGTDASAAMITATVAAIFQAVFTLVAQSAPVIGLLLSGIQQVEDLLIRAIGGAIGNIPCPAFPFIRVMAPSSGVCDLTTQDITSSLLGTTSNARWPVSIGGLTRAFSVDGKSFTVVFGADTTADLVARRINAAAALVGLGVVATVRSGQVHVEGRDPSFGAARATGGTACALGFPGACTSPGGTTTTVCSDGTTVPAGTPCPPPPAPPSSGGGLLLGAGALLALRFLLF